MHFTVLTPPPHSWDEGLVDMCIGEKRTLTIGPDYGYGQRSVGPIPAGSTLGTSPAPPPPQPHANTPSPLPVFETELMGIDGVEKPETIVTKSSATESATAKVAEKVASVASEAAEAVKTMVADTDDQEHNEL